MIRLSNVGITFNAGTANENNALKNINLTINKGDFITIIGSNGAGKSTLFNLIAGTLSPSTGSIYLTQDGVELDITRMSEYKRARYIGRIFQNPLLGTAGNMSLEDNMTICYKKGFKGLKKSLNQKLRQEFAQKLKILDMNLENRLKDNVEQFSGGQRQALTLLTAVLSHPALLLLDEHTAALDPANAEQVMQLTRRFADEYGLTVMMITHSMQQAIETGNRLLMMDAGEIILDIGADDKKRLSQEDLIAQFRAIKNKDLSSDKMLLQ